MDNGDFLRRLNVALGFSHTPVNEAGVLKEIQRLREAAGETESLRVPFEMEHLTVGSIRLVPNGGPRRVCCLWITTEAGIVEQSSQVQDEEPQHEILELPERMLMLMFDEEQAREAHRLLDEQVQDWG